MNKRAGLGLITIIAFFAIAVFLPAGKYLALPGATTVRNPGFKAGAADGIPAGWNATGSKDAVLIQTGDRASPAMSAFLHP
jgi:hypothetical protein